MRTAIAAREGLQGFEVQGRPVSLLALHSVARAQAKSHCFTQIDIHYSLPRDEDDPKRKCDREKNQGTIRVVLKDNPAPIREQDLERMFGGFGDIKGMYFSGGNPSIERLVEFFDSRATCQAFDRMQGAPYPSGGRVELFFDWDVKDIPISHPPAGPRPTNPSRDGGSNDRNRPPPAAARESMPPPPTPMSASSSNYDRPPPHNPPYQAEQRPPYGQDNRPPYQQNNDRPPYQQNSERPPYQQNQPAQSFRQPPPPNQMPPPPMPPHHFNGQPPTPASSVPSLPQTPRDPREYDRPPYGSHPPPTPPFAPNHNTGGPPQQAPAAPAMYGREVTPQYQPGSNNQVPPGPQSVSPSHQIRIHDVKHAKSLLCSLQAPPIPPPGGQAGSPPPNLSNLLASLGHLPASGPSSAPPGSSNFQRNAQAPSYQDGRDRPYTPSDPYGRPNDPDRVASYSTGPAPPSNYRPVPPSGGSSYQHSGPGASQAGHPAQQHSSPPLPPPEMLALLGQQQGSKMGPPPPQSPADQNNAPRFPPPPGPYDQKQHEYTPSAPAHGAPPSDQNNTQVNALLAMLSSQQR